MGRRRWSNAVSGTVRYSVLELSVRATPHTTIHARTHAHTQREREGGGWERQREAEVKKAEIILEAPVSSAIYLSRCTDLLFCMPSRVLQYVAQARQCRPDHKIYCCSCCSCCCGCGGCCCWWWWWWWLWRCYRAPGHVTHYTHT